MHQVEISYTVSTFGFRKRLKRQVPAAWNELTSRQLLAIIRLLHIPMDTQQLKLRLLKALLRIKWHTLLSFTAEQVVNIGHLTDFIFQDNNLTVNLLPIIRVTGFSRFPLSLIRSVFYGPGERFRNLIFSEFVCAEGYFMHYSQTQSVESLDKLIATVYRPKRQDYNPKASDYNGDIRENFNDVHIAGRARLISHLPLLKKQAILMYYAGCRSELTRLYPYVFSSEESNKQVQHPWLQMIGQIPNDKFGTIQQIEHVRLHQVLFHLNQMIKENQEAIQEMERQRR